MTSTRKNKAVLVTGGAGYIGSHAAKALSLKGYLPVVYDDLSRGHRWAVQYGPLETGCLTDRARLLEVMGKYSPAAVMHFAAYAYVGESVKEPLKYYRNNVAGSLCLVEAMVEAGVGLMVFSSSCAVYGIPRALPIAEDHPRDPISPYGMTKLIIERLLEDTTEAHGLRFAALRYFNAAGADPEGELGEVHEPETHLIPLALKAALGKTGHLTVFGDDYPTPDGTCIRDYIHVTDLAEAHIAALDYLVDGGGSCALNLGTGSGHSVKEIIDAAARVSGKEVPVKTGPRRPGDPPELVAEVGRAASVLGWRPRLSDLKTILETAYEWEKKVQ